MELFRKIRLKIGKYILERRKSRATRKIAYGSIDRVKKLLVLWDASRPGEFPALTDFYNRMQERGIKTEIMAYYPGDTLPDQYTAIRYLTCIRRNELNSFYIPVVPEAEKCIAEPYDVLIEVNSDRLFPLQYISTLSAASFKVGLSDTDPGNAPYDLMMELKPPVRTEEYLRQVLHYLEMINSGTDTEA